MTVTTEQMLARLEAKIDTLSATMAAGQVAIATLDTRVQALEKHAERRWQLTGAWIGSATALVIAVLDLVMHR